MSESDTERERLLERARKARLLAKNIQDVATELILLEIAAEYEERAAKADGAMPPPPEAKSPSHFGQQQQQPQPDSDKKE